MRRLISTATDVLGKTQPFAIFLPGTFWMKYADFVRCFTEVTICKYDMTSNGAGKVYKRGVHSEARKLRSSDVFVGSGYLRAGYFAVGAAAAGAMCSQLL